MKNKKEKYEENFDDFFNYGIIKKYGSVSEWFKESVLKTDVGKLTVSSNLTASSFFF
jgi:hypothetical protein